MDKNSFWGNVWAFVWKSIDTENLKRSFSHFRTIIRCVYVIAVRRVIGDTSFRTYRNTIYSYNTHLNYKFILSWICVVAVMYYWNKKNVLDTKTYNNKQLQLIVISWYRATSYVKTIRLLFIKQIQRMVQRSAFIKFWIINVIARSTVYWPKSNWGAL